MNILLIAAMLVVLPLMASALDMHEGKDWRDCKQDSDCILIDGPCRKIAVNTASKDVARAYFKQKSATAECQDHFWEANVVVPRCRLDSCSTTPKPANTKPAKR